MNNTIEGEATMENTITNFFDSKMPKEKKIIYISTGIIVKCLFY